MKPQTILVTGANGTVGRALIDQLLDAGVPVRAVTRRPATARLHEDVQLVQADLDDPAPRGREAHQEACSYVP